MQALFSRSSMEMDLSHAGHWTYGAEGNQTIVLRYTGNDPQFMGRILRLAKQSLQPHQEPPPPQFSVDFSNNVITPLIGSEYMVPLCIVSVSPEFLQAVSIKIEMQRPERRRSRHIDHDQRWAFLARDLTYNYPWAVELKPKWGFKPASSKIKHTHQRVKGRTCRFCMHSCLKHGRADLAYCPLDLYSRDPARVGRALHALRNERHLHKNYHKHDQGGSSSNGGATDDDTWMDELVQAVLCRDPILARLHRLQRRLDHMDIEGIWTIYTSTREQSLPEVYDIDTWKKVVQRFKTRRRLQAEHDIDTSEEEHHQHLFEYVLSMIFKDCSIFISVAEESAAKSHPSVVRLSNGKTYRYEIKLVDVDLKMMAKIPYWYELDQRIVTHAIEMDYVKHCKEVIWESDQE